MPKDNASARKKASSIAQTDKDKQPIAKAARNASGSAASQVSLATAKSLAEGSATSKKSRGGSKGNRARIGGTAVPGAKSTQPKELPTSNNPSEQQAAGYNRDMRRRMQNLGTGPYSEGQKKTKTPQERRKEAIERRKEKIEARRAELRKSVPGKISIGSKNTYFVIAIGLILLALIVLFIILRQVLHLF